jgi:hypothetical protein
MQLTQLSDSRYFNIAVFLLFPDTDSSHKLVQNLCEHLSQSGIHELSNWSAMHCPKTLINWMTGLEKCRFLNTPSSRAFFVAVLKRKEADEKGNKKCEGNFFYFFGSIVMMGGGERQQGVMAKVQRKWLHG